MKINIISVGKFDNSSINELFLEYQKRLKTKVFLKEIHHKYSNNIEEEKLKKIEGELIIKNIENESVRIFLDESGKNFTSKEFANILNKFNIEGHSTISFIIGGAYGLDKNIIGKNDLVLSLSKMTFPHLMVRIVLIEQIYRAFSIIANHPYHK
jgi:23S rRNA (pseudouridine1915-N3)-methyltransferase